MNKELGNVFELKVIEILLFKLVSQCKYKTNNKVEFSEIRNFLGAINEDDVICLFVTNSGCTFKARKQAEASKKNIHQTTTNEDDNNYIHKILNSVIKSNTKKN
jgi:hypothetical protein